MPRWGARAVPPENHGTARGRHGRSALEWTGALQDGAVRRAAAPREVGSEPATYRSGSGSDPDRASAGLAPSIPPNIPAGLSRPTIPERSASIDARRLAGSGVTSILNAEGCVRVKNR